MCTIDIRVELIDRIEDEALMEAEETLIHQLVRDNFFVKSAAVLRNDGFANMTPDEDTRQER
jgi:hypothetical protein